MNYIQLIGKGFFIGIALIIPGLSGGTLAVYMGIYEKLLHAFGNIMNEFKKSLQFLIPVFLGIAISVIGLARLVGYFLDINSFVVLVFFMGLLLGGTKDVYQKAKTKDDTIKQSSIIAFLISFTVIILLVVFDKLGSNVGVNYIDINLVNIIVLFFLGMAASMTMIVPGISGSALLIVLGYYTAIVTNVVGEILDFTQFTYNIQIVIPFAIGAALGIILFSRVIEFALKKYSAQTYFAILGFIIASVFAIFFEIKDPSSGVTHEVQVPIYKNLFEFLGNNLTSLFGGIILFVIGFYISKYLTKLEMKKKDKIN